MRSFREKGRPTHAWHVQVDRLVKEHPAVWRDYVAGKYSSVRAAAVAAGIVEASKSAKGRKR
jgi:hypothetical protein